MNAGRLSSEEVLCLEYKTTEVLFEDAARICQNDPERVLTETRSPDWEGGDSECGDDWETCVPESVRVCWPHLSMEAKLVAYLVAAEYKIERH